MGGSGIICWVEAGVDASAQLPRVRQAGQVSCARVPSWVSNTNAAPGDPELGDRPTVLWQAITQQLLERTKQVLAEAHQGGVV